jgi:hypothetical protein
MANSPCPQGDGGICGMPSETQGQVLLLWDRTVSIVSFPVLEQLVQRQVLNQSLEATRQLFVPRGVIEETLFFLFSSSRVQGEEFDTESLRDRIEANARMIAAEAGTDRGAIITCSCGHTWILDI